MALSGFGPTGEAGLTASLMSSRVLIPTAGTPMLAMVTNLSTNTVAFVLLGDNTVIATVATGFPILPQTSMLLTIGAATSIAAICSAFNAPLRISAGN